MNIRFPPPSRRNEKCANVLLFPPRRARFWKTSEILVRIEKNGHRAIVNDFHFHVRLKHPCLHPHVQLFQVAHKSLEQYSGLLWRRGMNETGAALPSRIAVERKLRNRQNRAGYLK